MERINPAHIWHVHYTQKRVGFRNKSKIKQPANHLNAYVIEDLGKLVAFCLSICRKDLLARRPKLVKLISSLDYLGVVSIGTFAYKWDRVMSRILSHC
jgi:hypothetical protein